MTDIRIRASKFVEGKKLKYNFLKPKDLKDLLAEFCEEQLADLEKQNEELKDYNKKLLQSDIDKQNKIVLLSKKVNDLQKKNVGLKDELNKAKVIINKWLRVYNTNTTKEVIKESEDFLKEIKEK